MGSYEKFADLYDIMMVDTPYDEWVEYILEIFQRFEIDPEIILDLGCGTGEITNRLASKGYSMIGVDLSEDMLLVAREKSQNISSDILYLNQDMTEFELYGTVGAVISTCDSINYILNEEDLLQCFRLVNNYLDPEGLFIFDINTAYKFRESLGNQTFAENHEGFSYIWENYYYEEDEINEYELTMFVEEDGCYHRFYERHLERAYTIEQIKRLLEMSGLKLEAIYSEGTFSRPIDTSERIYFIAREKDKEIKGDT